jgi:uncharacterized Zn-binding protein involved in type VI secretion
MPAAVRTGDETSHAGTITIPPPGALKVETVLIGGRPAAVLGSLHVCPIPEHAALGPANVVIPSPGGVTEEGVVLIGGLPAATMGDQTVCEAEILTGDFTVLIGGA